jgi:hypothetical protein
MSKKSEEWVEFSKKVFNHIEEYTIPQYGDYPDLTTDFTIQDIKAQLVRYVGRVGSGVRGEKEALRDCKKIAHYACVLYSKINQR